MQPNHNQCDRQVHNPLPHQVMWFRQMQNANVKLDIVDDICVFVDIIMLLNRSLIQ